MRLSAMYSRFLVAAVPLFQFVSVEAACYYPNGDLNPDDVPCNSSADASVCCGRGWTCLSNGVCMLGQDSSVGSISRIGSTYRTSCTDRSWNSTACPDFCRASPWNLGVYQAVSSCGQHSWCCQSESVNAAYCCTQNKKFNLSDVQENALQVPLTSSSLPNPAATGKSSGNLSAAADPSSSSSVSSFHSKLQTIALGIGLGVPFGLTLIACLFFLVRKHHRARKARQAIPTHQQDERDSAAWKSSPSGSVEMPADQWAVEASGYQKFELQGGKLMPVEISG